MHTIIDTYTYKYIYTYIHSYTHTHICIYIKCIHEYVLIIYKIFLFLTKKTNTERISQKLKKLIEMEMGEQNGRFREDFFAYNFIL